MSPLLLAWHRAAALRRWSRYAEMFGTPIPRLRRFRGRGQGLSGNARQRRKARRARQRR